MAYKLLAQLPVLTDLFPRQEVAAVGEKLVDTELMGTDFKLAVGAQDFVPEQPDPTLQARLTLPLVPLLGQRPVLPVTLPLLRQSAEIYLVQGLDRLQAEMPALAAGPSLAIHAGKATLRLGVAPWQLTLQDAGGGAVASIVLAGGIRFDVTRLVIDASGVSDCVAVLVPGQVRIGDLALQVSAGTLAVRGSRLEARLQAWFELDYFRGARVDLELAVGGDLGAEAWSITGLTRIANNVPWHDPSGMLGFDRMTVKVGFASTGAGHAATVSIGGRVTFLPRALADGADAWFGRLFSGLALSFEDTPLTLADIGLPTFSFSPPEGLRLRLFEIFDMTVPTLDFGRFGVGLSGTRLRVEAGGAVLSGSVSRIAIRLQDGPALDIGGGEPEIALELAAPGGFKGQAALRQIKGANKQALQGEGRISSPALPPVEAMFQVGRFRPAGGEDWLPTLSIMVAREDVNVTLFPGVVATRVELGAGINRTLAGVTGLTLAEGRRRVQDGLPDAFRQESWQDGETDLCVVARVFAEPSPTQGDAVQSLYVADLTLLMTSNLQFAALGKLWFYTSRKDARSAPFQKLPSAVGLAMFDGQQPSLRVVAMTRSDGRSSLSERIPAGALLGMSVPRSELAFEATPSGMLLALGPIEIDTTLGPLRTAGSASFVLRSAGGQVYAISRASLTAAFNASTGSVSIGIATFSGSVGASFAASLALLGHGADGRLTVYGLAHASCSVELALHVRLGFEIRIRTFLGSVTISWHQDSDFTMALHVDLDLEAALDSGGGIGIDGRAQLSVNVLGFSAGLALRIAVGDGLVQQGRQLFRNAQAEVDTLLGAPA